MNEDLGSPITLTLGPRTTITSAAYNGMPIRVTQTSSVVRFVGVPLCPDLLRYEQLGEADGWRGRVIRVFFWLLRVWPAS
jgi:hypothetical protein